jgi:exoribonuclease R
MNEDAGVSHTPANPTFSVFHDPVLRAAAWYAGKVRGAFPVVILSDDRASTLNGGVDQNANLASEMRRRLPPGVEVLAADEYFPRFHSNDVDVMNAFESVREANEAAMKADEERKLLGLGFDAGEGGNRARAFAPHWDNDAIVSGLESGELMRGTIKVCRWRPEEATVRVGEDEERTDAADDGNDNTLETFGDVLVPSRTLRNRALDGDGVAVRLLPRSRWVPAEGAHTVAEGNSDSDSEEEDDTNGDEEKAGADDKKRTKRRLVPTAEVVGVLRRRGADIVATIAEDKAPEGARTRPNNARSNSVLVIPMDRRFPRCRLLTRRADALGGQRLVVRITRWPAHSKHPEARVVRALGKCGDLTAEVNALLAEHDIETNAFSPVSFFSSLYGQFD